jgi:hypothetical protein
MVAVERGDDDLRLSDITQLATALGVDIAQLSGVHVRSSRSTDSSTANYRPPLPGINTLLVEHDEARLQFSGTAYQLQMRRLLFNASASPVTRFLVRIAVDRHPGDPERSNQLYRANPLTWDELAFWSNCHEEPMTWTIKHDRDAFKELYLRFENEAGHRFPLYPGDRTWIEYGYTVGDDKWGSWFQRAVRWPTARLAVELVFPTDLDPVVWGTETSVTAEAFPLRTPIIHHGPSGTEHSFTWGIDNPPLHTRYRLEWKFRNG